MDGDGGPERQPCLKFDPVLLVQNRTGTRVRSYFNEIAVMETELPYCKCGSERRASLENYNPTPMLLLSRPTRHRTDLTTFHYVFTAFLTVLNSLLVCDTFLLSYNKFLLSFHSDLLVSTTLSVLPIRLEPDLLVSTTFQLHLPACSRINKVLV